MCVWKYRTGNRSLHDGRTGQGQGCPARESFHARLGLDGREVAACGYAHANLSTRAQLVRSDYFVTTAHQEPTLEGPTRGREVREIVPALLSLRMS